MLEKLKSRKFILAVASGVLIILNDGLGWGVDTETVLGFVGLVASYIFGEAAVDIAKVRRGE